MKKIVLNVRCEDGYLLRCDLWRYVLMQMFSAPGLTFNADDLEISVEIEGGERIVAKQPDAMKDDS